jgi:hypothetical protein
LPQVDDDPDALFLANEEEAPEDDVVGDEDLQLEGSDTGGSSEDELEAYDLEDDESDLSQVKIPVYLRDVLAGKSPLPAARPRSAILISCLSKQKTCSGLRAKDEPDRLEGAIKAAEALIRADARGNLIAFPPSVQRNSLLTQLHSLVNVHQGDLHDISLDLMRTLLHLFNQYELEGFGEMRFKVRICGDSCLLGEHKRHTRVYN